MTLGDLSQIEEMKLRAQNAFDQQPCHSVRKVLFEAVAVHMHGGDCGEQRNHTEQKGEITVAASFKYASH